MNRGSSPAWIIFANQYNAGYPAANNQGLRWCGFDLPSQPSALQGERGVNAALLVGEGTLPRFALLLNPDTVLPANALTEMLAFMAAHPRAGAAGPKLVRLDGSLDKACRRSFPTPTTSLYHLLKLCSLCK